MASVIAATSTGVSLLTAEQLSAVQCRTITISSGQRPWTLHTGADYAASPDGSNATGTVVGTWGTVLFALTALVVYLRGNARRRVEAIALAVTTDLHAAYQTDSEQAKMFAAVVDSISDGVGVVDEHGAFIAHNPAAKQLLGVDDIDNPADWPQHCGLFRPDGITVLPVEELPLVHALAGHSSDTVSMVIRNHQRAER